MSDFLLAVAAAVMVNAFVCLYQGVRGPTIQDRLISINIVNTKTLVVLVLIFFAIGSPAIYMDVAIVYALLNFVVTVAVSRYLEAGGPSIG